MGTPTSSSDQVVDYVLGEDSLFRPLTGGEYLIVINRLLDQLQSRLRYYGFKELHVDQGSEYDRVVAQNLSEHIAGRRMKQVYVDSIRFQGCQSMFYLSDKAEWLMVTGYREGHWPTDGSSQWQWGDVRWMHDVTGRWLTQPAMAAFMAAPDTPSHLGLHLCNGLLLIVQDAIAATARRLEGMQRDADGVGEVVQRMRRLAA